MFKSTYTLALLIFSAYFSWVYGQGSFPEKFTVKGSLVSENHPQSSFHFKIPLLQTDKNLNS